MRSPPTACERSTPIAMARGCTAAPGATSPARSIDPAATGLVSRRRSLRVVEDQQPGWMPAVGDGQAVAPERSSIEERAGRKIRSCNRKLDVLGGIIERGISEEKGEQAGNDHHDVTGGNTAA